MSVLKQLHDDLDAAVFEAYGWSDLLASAPSAPPRETLSATILTRLVALNAARAAEEAAGTIRWLRPEYQQMSDARGQRSAETQTEMSLPTPTRRKPTKNEEPRTKNQERTPLALLAPRASPRAARRSGNRRRSRHHR